MHKNATINTRIEPKLKKHAEAILHKMGMTSAEAIRLFYAQISLHKGLPFEVKIPNKVTLNAMHDADTGKTFRAGSVDDLFDDLD